MSTLMKKATLLIFTIYILTIPNILFGQTTFRYRISNLGGIALYPNSYSNNKILLTTDGSYLFGYHDYLGMDAGVGLILFDSVMTPIWNKLYNNPCGIIPSDPIFLFETSGENFDLGINTEDCGWGKRFLYKLNLDNSGNILSTFFHLNAGYEDDNMLENLEHNFNTSETFILANYHNDDEGSSGVESHQTYYNRYDSSDVLIFSKAVSSTLNPMLGRIKFNYSQMFYNQSGLAIEHLIFGDCSNPSGKIIIKLDSAGNELWTTLYTPHGFYNHSVLGVIKIDSSYYLLESFESSTLIHKIDLQGNTQATIQFNNIASIEGLASIAVTDSGSTILIAAITDLNEPHPVLMKLDTALNPISIKYSPSSKSIAAQILPDDESAIFAYLMPNDTAVFIEKTNFLTSCSFIDTTFSYQNTLFFQDTIIYFIYDSFPIGGNYSFNVSNQLATSALECITSGIEEKEININIYPNPASNHITISVPGAMEWYKMELYDSKGVKIFNQDFNYERIIDVNFLESGIYLIRVIGKKDSWTKKVIIQK